MARPVSITRRWRSAVSPTMSWVPRTGRRTLIRKAARSKAVGRPIQRILQSGASRSGAAAPVAAAALDVIGDQGLELLGDALAAQRACLLAVDEHRRRRALAGAGQADPDVGVLALARAVDDAAHDRDVQRLDPGIVLLPDRHLRAQVFLDALRQLLEVGAGGAPAARTRRHLRRELAQAQALQQLLADDHLLGACLARPRRQRSADGIAD